MTQVKQAIENNAFDKGLRAVDAISEQLGKRCRAELAEGLDIHSRQAFRQRARGLVNHTNLERQFIEQTFGIYNVTDCWGFA